MADAVMRLLTKSGARVEHEAMLGRLEGAGCRVDRSAQRCYFTEKLIQDMLATFSRPDRNLKASLPENWTRNFRIAQMGSHPHLLEWPSCKRRLATVQDVRDMVKLAHTADEFGQVGQTLTCAQIAPPVEPIWNAVTRMELTDKPIGSGEVLYPETVKYMAELGKIYGDGKDARIYAACDFSVSPLIFSGRVIGCMMEKSRFGAPHLSGTMPISGMSTPVTIAGTAVVAAAELMAGWVIYYLLDPKIPAYGVVCSGSLDMRSSQVCFGSPEALLQDLAAIEVCWRQFGMPVGTAVNYIDAKTPGLRAVYEKMLPLIASPMRGYGHLMGDGLLSAGQDYCPVQHLLELDFLRGIGRFYEGFEINSETLAVDLIEQVIRGEHKDFLDTDHTLVNFRGEQWYPRWLDRTGWSGEQVEGEIEAKLLDAIAAYCRESIARYEPPALDACKLEAAREVLRRAEVELAGVGA